MIKSKASLQHRIKKLLALANIKLVARLLASDFTSQNPRTQTRNFLYTNTSNKQPTSISYQPQKKPNI